MQSGMNKLARTFGKETSMNIIIIAPMGSQQDTVVFMAEPTREPRRQIIDRAYEGIGNYHVKAPLFRYVKHGSYAYLFFIYPSSHMERGTRRAGLNLTIGFDVSLAILRKKTTFTAEAIRYMLTEIVLICLQQDRTRDVPDTFLTMLQDDNIMQMLSIRLRECYNRMKDEPDAQHLKNDDFQRLPSRQEIVWLLSIALEANEPNLWIAKQTAESLGPLKNCKRTNVDIGRWMYAYRENDQQRIETVRGKPENKLTVKSTNQAATDNPRIKTLISKVNGDFRKACERLGWEITVYEIDDAHSCIAFAVIKGGETHRIGYFYSQSTSRQVYDRFGETVEFIFIYGIVGFDSDNVFSRGCIVSVLPERDFQAVLTDWNLRQAGVSPYLSIKKRPQEQIRIVDENPLEQIYSHLRALTSLRVSMNAIKNHGGEIDETTIVTKAEGVAQLVQNAMDFYNSAATENLTQRLLNLYYGSFAFMQAEILATGDKYRKLADIERISKAGHGMIAFGDAATLDDFYVGFIRGGVFYSWLKNRGIAATDFAERRQDAENSALRISLRELFEHIPELQSILQEIDRTYRPRFLFPHYDMAFNYFPRSEKAVYQRMYEGGYVTFLNASGKADLDWEKALIETFLGPIKIVGRHKDVSTGAEGWETFVQYPEGASCFDSCNAYKGMSTSAVIQPLFNRTDDWEVFAIIILYALSIIVRYMPNLWVRITKGDLDQYKAVIYQFARVTERELSQIFLEKLTNKRINVINPQSLI